MQARSWLLAIGSLLFVVRASSAQGTAEVNSNGPAAPPQEASSEPAQTVTPQERETLNLLHESNRVEVEAGRMATQRARSVTIKRFGQFLVKSQTTADRELTAVAKQNHVELENSGDAQFEQLKRTWDPALFDRRFLNLLARNQADSLRSVQAARESAQNASVQAFIDKTAPSLHEHETATLLQLRNSPF